MSLQRTILRSILRTQIDRQNPKDNHEFRRNLFKSIWKKRKEGES